MSLGPDALPEKQIVFVTNNATKSRKTYKKKFDHLGVEAHVVRARVHRHLYFYP